MRAAGPAFSSVCGSSSKGHIHLKHCDLHEMVILMHGRSASDLFLLVQMKITMMFQVRRKIISLIAFQEEY